jgi:TolA-binding protein
MEKSDSTKVKNFSGTGNSIPSSTKSNGKEEVASSLNPGSDKTSSISSVSGNPQNNKKKKKAEGTDPSKSSFERGSYHLNRSARNSAGEEFNTSSTTEGEFSTKSKLDLIRLYGLERRKADADGILSGITEPELRFKALFEYAHALETSAGSDKKLKEESIQPLLLIITEAPKENFLVPRALWSLGNLMFRIENFTPSLDYLSRLIKEYPESEYTPGAIYLSGRIYEESPALRNPARAREFYDLFISRSSKSDVSENYSKNIYFEEVKKRRNRLY